MPDSVDARIKGSPLGHYLQELLTNSAHFPLANFFLELLLHETGEYFLEPDAYILFLAALIQAFFLTRWRLAGQPIPLFGNLIGPTLYSGIELLLEGGEFFSKPHHLAYWGFSLGIGLMQQAQLHSRGRLHNGLIIIEHTLRSCIVLGMYIILETYLDHYQGIGDFLDDGPHLFIAVVIPLLGVLLGFANLNAGHYLTRLREMANQLRQYSEWLLGKQLLARAVDDPRSLLIHRQQRVVLFMDIRGFTQWSEQRSPESVVTMINNYYETAEPVWRRYQALKVKLTADEIMLLFADAASALSAAIELRDRVQDKLEAHGLSAGIGIHQGPVVEGLIGAKGWKSFDIIGDSVNTAKRLCDRANGGEILISESLCESIPKGLETAEKRSLILKGKQQPLSAYPLLAVRLPVLKPAAH